MPYKYSRYIGEVSRHPWAILPEKFAAISELIRLRASGARLTDEQIADRVGPRSVARTGGSPTGVVRGSGGAVAVIPVHGTIAYRADSFEASSGGTSTELIGRMLQRAMADDTVTSILFDFNSPGGSVDGIDDLCKQIAKAGKTKRVVAHVNSMAASAAYWLASQCSEIVSMSSGQIGSIGVYMLLLDESEALANAGIKINAISAGQKKLEGAPWEPLSDDARAFLQAQVDDVYAQFLATVAAGRGTSAAAVKAGYGQGRCLPAKDALAAGMIDRIAALDDVLTQLAAGTAAPGRRMPFAAAGRTAQQAIDEEHILITAILAGDRRRLSY
jgi:signal peptide peptidase SppA